MESVSLKASRKHLSVGPSVHAPGSSKIRSPVGLPGSWFAKISGMIELGHEQLSARKHVNWSFDSGESCTVVQKDLVLGESVVGKVNRKSWTVGRTSMHARNTKKK